MNEADTCRTYILPKLKDSGWEDDAILEQYVLTPGRIVPVGNQHTRKQGLRPDYALFIRRDIPIAVVEAKAEYVNAANGLAQIENILVRSNDLYRIIGDCGDEYRSR